MGCRVRPAPRIAWFLAAAVAVLLCGCSNDSGRPVPGFCEGFEIPLGSGAATRGDVIALRGTRFAAALGFPQAASLTIIDLADRKLDGTLALPAATALVRAARPSGSSRLFVEYLTGAPSRPGLAEMELETPSVIRNRDYPGVLNGDLIRGAALDPARQRLYLSVYGTSQTYDGIVAADARNLDLLDLDGATAIDRVALSNAHFPGSFQFPGDVAFDPIGDLLVVANGGSQAITFVAGSLLGAPHDPEHPQGALPRVAVGGTPVAVDVDPESRVAVVSVSGTMTPATHRLVVVDLDTRAVLSSWDMTMWGAPEANEIAAVPGTEWVASANANGNQAAVRLFDWKTGGVVLAQTGITGLSWIDVAPAYNLGIGVDRSRNQFVGYCLEP